MTRKDVYAWLIALAGFTLSIGFYSVVAWIVFRVVVAIEKLADK